MGGVSSDTEPIAQLNYAGLTKKAVSIVFFSENFIEPAFFKTAAYNYSTVSYLYSSGSGIV